MLKIGQAFASVGGNLATNSWPLQGI